jgi:hypothetical protein
MSDSDRDVGPDENEGWKFEPDGNDGDDRGESAVEGTEPDAENWRFELDEVGEDGVVEDSIEPQHVDFESAVFVLLGALAMVLVFVRLWMIFS